MLLPFFCVRICYILLQINWLELSICQVLKLFYTWINIFIDTSFCFAIDFVHPIIINVDSFSFLSFFFVIVFSFFFMFKTMFLLAIVRHDAKNTNELNHKFTEMCYVLIFVLSKSFFFLTRKWFDRSECPKTIFVNRREIFFRFLWCAW